MRRIFPIVLLLVSQYLTAQLEIIGSKSYGQILFMEYDKLIPNKIYAATVRNHIVVSEDNGLNWSLFYTVPTIDYRQINSLKVHDSNTLSFTLQDSFSNCNRIYMLDTASRQIASQYLVPIPQGSDQSSITAYDFYDNNTLIAQQIWGISDSRYAKVYYTTNAGATWNIIYDSTLNNSIFPNDVAIAPNNPSKLFIARAGGLDPNDYGGLLVSDDEGINWEEKLSGIELGSITFHPETANDILLGSWFGTITHLYHSSDGGENWDDLFPDLPEEMTAGIMDIAYNPNNSNNVLVLGMNEIMRTSDGFASKEVIHFTNNIEDPNNYFSGSKIAFNPFRTDEMLITNNDYPLRSVNGGQSVQKIDNPYFVCQRSQMGFYENATEKHLYYSVQNGLVHQNLVDNSETTTGIQPIQFSSTALNQYYADSNRLGRVYMSSQGLTASGIAYTDNHGATIDGFTSPNTYLQDIVSKPADSHILFCALSNDLVQGNLRRFDITDSNNIQQIEISLPATGLVRALHFDTAQANQLWIALNNKLYRTTDEGLTWIQQTTGLEILNEGDSIFHITQNPLNPEQLTIATSQGIFTSTDHGNHWTQLASYYTHYVQHSEANPKNLVAITYDTQFTNFTLRYSGNEGVTWHEVTPEALHYLYSGPKNAKVDFKNNIAEVYIGTYDMGVVKYTIDFELLSNPEFVSQKKYQLFPNPTRSMLYVKSLIPGDSFDFSLTDLTGKTIKANTSGTSIDLSTLSSGCYFLKILSKNGTQEVHRIVKE